MFASRATWTLHVTFRSRVVFVCSSSLDAGGTMALHRQLTHAQEVAGLYRAALKLAR